MLRRFLYVSLLALGCTIGTVGCGTARQAPKAVWSPEGKPMTTIQLEDETSWPFEIAEVRIALDGEALVDHVAPEGVKANWAFEVPFEALPAGEHFLRLELKARYASTRMDATEGCAVTYRASEAFITGDEPVGVLIVVDTDDVTRRFADRLSVDIAMAGATRPLEIASPVTERELVAPKAACLDDGPLPFDDHDLAQTRHGPDLLR